MKKIILTVTALVSMFLMFSCSDDNNNDDGGGYDNSDLNGVWIEQINGIPKQVAVPTGVYLIFDGAGTMTEIGVCEAGENPGSYNVNSDGSFTGQAMVETDTVNFYGQITSATEAELNAVMGTDTLTIPVYKVQNKAACQGNWSGFLKENDQDVSLFELDFTVGADGEITNCTGFPSFIEGRLYYEHEMLTGMLYTGENAPYDKIQLGTGTFTSDLMEGHFDVSDGEDGLFYFVPQDMGYTDASFIGTWVIDMPNKKQQTGGNSVYIVMDGEGTISEIGAFGMPADPGTYSVREDGFYSGIVIDQLDTMIFWGQLENMTMGTFSLTIDDSTGTAPMYKVLDKGACQGDWSGHFAGEGLESFGTTLTIDQDGIITASTGLTGPVSGKLFYESGILSGFISTGDTGEFSGIMIENGNLNTEHIEGNFELDGNNDGSFYMEPVTAYTNETLSAGAWMIIISENDMKRAMYLLTDGAGTFNDLGSFGGTNPLTGNTGTYSINSSGEMTASLWADDQYNDVFGNVVSETIFDLNVLFTDTTGTDTISFPLKKVTKFSDITGSWTGSFDYNGDIKNVTLTFDIYGNLSGATGLLGQTRGNFFYDHNFAAGYISTGEADLWRGIQLSTGTLDDNDNGLVLQGEFVLDTDSEIKGTYSLTKQ